MTSDDMPEEIYVRPVSKKTLSAVRPESPLVNSSVERPHIKYIRADKAVPEGQNHIADAGKMVKNVVLTKK